MKHLAVLGRQPELSLAELISLYGNSVRKIAPNLAVFDYPDASNAPATSLAPLSSATTPSSVSPAPLTISRLGGTLKLARLLDEPPLDYLENLPEGKITLGVSDYSKNASKRTARSSAMKLKSALKRHGRSVRVLENTDATLSTATSHHNQLSEKKNHIELILVDHETYVLTGVQNITAYAHRDRIRPARDAKVGMLPPKLAQILLNLCGPLPEGARLLDPFCGTGVVLQEALLMGYTPYGTDLSPRMVEFTKRNLAWLTDHASGAGNILITQGDATEYKWTPPISAVACETYLGPPMSNPPAEIKLKEAKQECGAIILGFLKNLAPQIAKNTPVVAAIPAWLRPDGSYSRLNLLDELDALGYNVIKFDFLGDKPLLYNREGQVVAREIIVLRKK